MAHRLRELVRAGVQRWFEEPVYFGFDDIPALQKHFAEKTPFVFVDHAYFGRGYERGNFRIVRNDIHQCTLKDVPSRGGYRVSGWKTGKHILVFPPSRTIAQTFDTKTWTAETVETLKKHTDRPVIVKRKEDGSLRDFLKDCHAVVGYGTVASVEAVVAGIPAFCGPHCPANPVGLGDLSRIENPIYPDREAWFNTLAWSQVSLDEIRSGRVKEVLDGVG